MTAIAGDFERFEQALNERLGVRVRESEAAAQELWSALANVEWTGPDGERVAYTFRAAGGIVAWIRQDGSTYLPWSLGPDPGHVATWIAEALHDWTPEVVG